MASICQPHRIPKRYQQAYPRSSRKKSNLVFFCRSYKLQLHSNFEPLIKICNDE